MFMILHKTTLVLALLLASLPFGRAEVSLQESLDIVPMPKEIRLTGKRLVLNEEVVLCVGVNASEQSRFGAEWINRRLSALKGKPLQISTDEGGVAGKVRIIIGTREDHPLIDQAAKAGKLNVGRGNPGASGYEIRQDEEGAVVYLAGADPVGALYACVTLGELLVQPKKGLPEWQVAEVRDWPDMVRAYVMGTEPPSHIAKRPDDPSARRKYLDALEKLYDEMLRRKLSMVWYKPLSWGEMAFRDMTPYARETARLGIEEGKRRGIASLFYHLYPFVGPAADHPNVHPDLLETKAKARYGKWVQSWSMDEERRAYARELAKWIGEIGFTDVGFHDTDTGGYLNPANWSFRGKADQERWGDDYAAATIRKFQIFYEELKKVNPELQLNFTLYPYNTEIFDPTPTTRETLKQMLSLDQEGLDRYRERYTSFWKQLHAAFPKEDVAFAIREPWAEGGEPGLKAFLSFIPGRPVFAWYGLAASEFYSNVPSWLGSLSSGNSSDMVFAQNNYIDKGYVPLLSYAVREYSWNIKAPGAAPYGHRDRARMHASAAGDASTDSYRVVLPRLVRNYFGREVAPEVLAAVSANVAPYIVFGGRPVRNIVDETEARMDDEAARASAAAASMDKAWAKREAIADPEVVARLAYLREVFHATRIVAATKAEVYRSQRLSSLNQFADAEAALQKANALLDEGRRTLDALASETPVVMKANPFNASMTLREALPRLALLVEERAVAMKARQKSGGIPTHVLNQLAQVEALPVVPGADGLVMDGKVDEPQWSKAHPQEAWFTVGAERLVSDARTQIRVLSDSQNLYISFRCWSAGGRPVGLEDSDREFVRVYVSLPGEKGGRLSAFSIWANGKYEALDKQPMVPVEYKVDLAAASNGVWSGELRIPFATLRGVKPERIGFLRGYGYSGLTHASSTVPLEGEISGGFEAAKAMLHRFPVIEWGAEPFRPTVRLRLVQPKIAREVTLDDRIATVAEFSFVAEADCVLDDVEVAAVAIGDDGRAEKEVELGVFPSINYHLKPSETFSIAFGQVVDKGKVELRLRSREARAEAAHLFDATLPKTRK